MLKSSWKNKSYTRIKKKLMCFLQLEPRVSLSAEAVKEVQIVFKFINESIYNEKKTK